MSLFWPAWCVSESCGSWVPGRSADWAVCVTSRASYPVVISLMSLSTSIRAPFCFSAKLRSKYQESLNVQHFGLLADCGGALVYEPSYVPLVFVVTLCFGLVHLVATHSMAPTCCDEEICLFRLYLGCFPPWKSTICSLLLANHTPYIFLTRTWSPRQTLNFKCCMFSLLL